MLPRASVLLLHTCIALYVCRSFRQVCASRTTMLLLGSNPPQTEVLPQEGAICPSICKPGYSCSELLGSTCQPCAKGFYSIHGAGCKLCQCDLASSDPEVCNKMEGTCICANLLNLCAAIPVFGNTSNLAWTIMVVVVVLTLIAGRIYLQQKKMMAADSMAMNQSTAMLRLQEALEEIQANVKTIRDYRPRSAHMYSHRVSRVKESMRKYRDENRESALSLQDGTDLDEVTTAIIQAAKTRIQQAKAGQQLERASEDYYVDRVTGKAIKDISMSRDDEGELLSVVYPSPNAAPNIKYDENNTTDIVAPRSYYKWGDSDKTSLHFATSGRAESRPQQAVKKKRKRLRSRVH